MASADVYKEFNHNLKTFIRELIKRYPDVKELKLAHGFYKMMKTVSKKSPQRYFHRMVAEKHSADILNKNFSYFLSDEFDDAEITYILRPLKEYFKNNVTDEDIDAMWKHLVILLACNKNCLLESKC